MTRRRGPVGRAGHERDRRRTPDRGRVRPCPGGAPGGAHPVRRRRVSRCGHELRDRPRRRRCRSRPARGRPPVLRPAGRRRDAPAGVRGGARGRRDARTIAPAHRADRRRAAGPPARPDGLRQPGHRRRRRRGRREAAGGRRRGRAHRGRPDARRGSALRGGRPGRRPGGRLSRRADDAARRAAPRSRPAAAASCIASRSSGSPAPGRPCPPRSAGSSARSRPCRPSRSRSGSGSAGRPTSGRSPKAGADGVIVASALVDSLGPDGRDVAALSALVASAGRGHRTVIGPIAVTIESSPKKTFATAVDFPGWSRSGKTEELALVALADYAPAMRWSPRRPARRSRPSRCVRGRRTDRRRERHRIRRPVDDHGPRPAAGHDRGGRATRPLRGGGLDGPRPGRRVRSGGAAQGAARGWPRPRQDDRPRRRGRLVLRPRDRDPLEAARTGRSGGARRDACRDARRPPRAVRRRRRSGSDAGPRGTRRGGSPGTRSTTPGRSRTGATPAR